MGHVINPISYRLANITYWNNTWFLFNSTNYSYLNMQDHIIFRFIKRFFKAMININTAGSLLINVKMIRLGSKKNMYIYVHDSLLEMNMIEIKATEFFRVLRMFFKDKFFYRIYEFRHSVKRKHARKFGKRFVVKHARKFFSLFMKNRVTRIFWDHAKKLLITYLRIIGINFSANEISILGLCKHNVNANIVSEFFYIRLKQFYTIWEVLRNINFFFRSLMRRGIVKGYKIICSGRFSRKQRATYSWKIFGSIAPSSVKSRLDYSYRTVVLKHSTCTIKVWIRIQKALKKKTDFVL